MLLSLRRMLPQKIIRKWPSLTRHAPFCRGDDFPNTLPLLLIGRYLLASDTTSLILILMDSDDLPYPVPHGHCYEIPDLDSGGQ
jgi:hypothetical protein